MDRIVGMPSMLSLRLNSSVMLFKPGLKFVPGLFGWNRLQLLLAELGAILQNLIRRGTRILISKVTRSRRASCKPSKLASGMTSMMMSTVAARVTTMPA
jgi:hypothetical protein